MPYLLNCDINLGKRYIELNGIVAINVCRHHLNDPGFQLWEMTGETTGLPHEYKLKRDAMRDAKVIAQRFNLPIVK